jgi:hypothetical protein
MKDNDTKKLEFLYENINKTTSQKIFEWIDVNQQLPKINDGFDYDGYSKTSKEVLATDGKKRFVCRYVKYPDDEESQWIIIGRDGYVFKNVIKWCDIPEI